MTMTTQSTPGAGFITEGFPAPGLPRTQRHITGYNAEGKSVFLHTDSGSHYRIMGEQQAIANILYSTSATPVDTSGDSDIKMAQDKEPPLSYPNGSVVRLIDYAPNVQSPLHRSISLGYGVVLEGIFQVTLDSGESKVLRQGDFIVQRATSHKWHNITGNGTLPGRMLYIQLGCSEVHVNNEEIKPFLGELAPYYEGREVQ
ncbi:hypothetical protein F5Y10DRAFT_252733 [Nemania abortiva]|nr:hypothetical protein F5Y10DRAFT_252733 [Nemania abortiva]